MATFLILDDFDLILSERSPARRAGLVCRLFADFDAGVLDAAERHAAASVFRAAVRDPETSVRSRFARLAAPSAVLPSDVADRLAGDIRPVAAPVIARSPVLSDDALIDLAADRAVWRQIAVAARPALSVAVAAALIEVADADACRALLANRHAGLPSFAFSRLIERFPHDHALREAMLTRPGVPVRFVEDHVTEVASRLNRFVVSTGWLAPETVADSTHIALENALIALAISRPEGEMAELVLDWSRSGRLTESLITRAAFAGATGLVEQSLSVMSRLPLGRVRRLMIDPDGGGLRSIGVRAGLQVETVRALRRAAHVDGALADLGDAVPLAGGMKQATMRTVLRLGMLMDRAFAPDLPLDDEAAWIADSLARSLRETESRPQAARQRRAA